MKAVLPFVALLGLAACSSPVLYAVDSPVPLDQRARIAFSSIEVVEVTLPRYAANPDIYRQAADGGLKAISGVSWADDPAPAMTADLVQVLTGMTGARIAAEPWPFRSYAQVRLDVRVTTMVARDQGDFLLMGQYYVAGQEDGFRERARPFAIAIPLPQGFGAAEVATARGLAVSELARQIIAGGLS
ncbi:Lipoprotein, putative [Ketogulonicigenium robustum]|uniref:Lipoprotein, putative n=1 Tax=Ketogulonicigenium robustum TaxID=92947 RepID=A0A1W6P1X9_9RHOB|nr:ABC-type transport auxiliary lipoprotein family protein [Ketogulonicigenium robustum]ARO15340.1 Lipoprotein, putative [Ketogulonicigenium robustum]